MRMISAFRTLAITSALILGMGGAAYADDEDASEKGETSSVEAAAPDEGAEEPAEAAEEAAEEKDLPAEKSDEEASEAEAE